MKIAKLDGLNLHLAVALADGRIDPHIEGDEVLFTHGEGGPVVRWDDAWFNAQVMPREAASKDNPEGMTIIGKGGTFTASYSGKHEQSGTAMSDAARRCFVAKVFGEDAPIEAAKKAWKAKVAARQESE